MVPLCQTFPSISPWNVYDLELRHLLRFTRAIDNATKEVEP
jgi:hypothetical protein